MNETLPATLPTAHDINNAPLPQRYEAAKVALAEATEVDECKSWADKALAIASYAKQSDDDTLLKLARRIQARAIRRTGELLSEFKKSGPGRGKKRIQGDQNSFSGDDLTKSQAANRAGMSRHQTAMATAVIPEKDFEEQVESDDPPTVTALAERGTKKRKKMTPRRRVSSDAISPTDTTDAIKRTDDDQAQQPERSDTETTQDRGGHLEGRSPVMFSRATDFIGSLKRFRKQCERSPADVLSGITTSEIEEVRRHSAFVQAWLEQFLEESK